ncbi:MAG: carbohydrate porin [Deltaproteobacteria bacterium]|nr:carbohydrate porin [Deltaproteobacteria bacterium]
MQILPLLITLAALPGMSVAAEPGGGDASAQSAGILPVPDYQGDLWNRSHLTGDWGGWRTTLAEKGIQFDVDNVNWVDSVVGGGSTDDAEIGGNITYNLKLDLMRAGILPGALIQVRGESRYGSSAILNTGQLTPNNSAALSPTNYSKFDAGHDIALSQLSYLQMFSPHFGVILGKLDLYAEGAPNEFAGGRGRTQFMNWNLNFSTPALFVPASTLGAGVVILPSENLTITSLLLSGTQCTHTDCFDDLDDKGGISVTTASYQYELFGLPGGTNGSFIYFFDGDFATIGSFAIGLDADGTLGLQGSTESDSWQVSVSFWQYLCVEDPHDGPLHLLNGRPDLEGWGVFGSVSVADKDTNPWRTSVAFGFGGRGVIPSRPNDLFGIGGFYNELASSLTVTNFGIEEDYAGAEAFYNFAITPAVRFSANVQYLPSVRPRINDATMVSGRLQFVF